MRFGNMEVTEEQLKELQKIRDYGLEWNKEQREVKKDVEKQRG